MDFNRTCSENSLFRSAGSDQLSTHQLFGRQASDGQLPPVRLSSGQPTAARSFFQRADDAPTTSAQVNAIQVDVADRTAPPRTATVVEQKQRTAKARSADGQSQRSTPANELASEEANESDSPTGYPPIDARAVWQKALSELQLQLASSTYFTWLHDTWVDGYEDGAFFIATANTYARDWLQHRLRSVVKRTLKNIVGHMVDVTFVVRPRQVVDVDGAPAAPLYQQAEPLPSVLPLNVAPVAERAERTPAKRGAAPPSQINQNLTFDSFIVGKHNQFAFAAAQAIVDKPGQKFNPLFVYGGVGLGKTHLLHSIGNALQRRGFSPLYCTSEQFTNELISAIRGQNTEQFRNKYRALDVLLIDDIQFISGKESTQEEVFHTFNQLQSAGKQVVLSSDRPPKALLTLEERLRSRFEGGIQVDISQPDFETRVAILQSKAAQLQIVADIDVLKLVAERVDSNIRELEGALNHLVLQSHIYHTRLDVHLALTALDHLAPQRKPCSPQKVLELAASHFHLSTEDLTGTRRTKNIADARHVAMYLLREDNNLSLPQIGQLLGGRDHTTVGHGIDKIAHELMHDEARRRDVVLLRDKIYTPFIG